MDTEEKVELLMADMGAKADREKLLEVAN